jgi:hypothetical protein
LQFQHARAPSPQVGPPFLLFFWVLHPHTPPGGTALNIWYSISLKTTEFQFQSCFFY